MAPGGVIGGPSFGPKVPTWSAEQKAPRRYGSIRVPVESPREVIPPGTATRNISGEGQARPTSPVAEGGVGGFLGGRSAMPSGRAREQGEAYFEWPVAEGVPPVLTSSPESALHDPGPGVIGIDR